MSAGVDPVREPGAVDPKQDPIIRARIRRMLIVLTILCTAIAVAGFAFVRWLFTLPPGSLKSH